MLGWNARLTEVQAAVGRVQLQKLDHFNAQRIRNAQYLTQRLSKIDGIVPPPVQHDVEHIFWQYTIRVQEEKLGVSRDTFRTALEAEGIETSVYYDPPIHRQPYFRELRGYGDTSCPFRCPWYQGIVDYDRLELPVVERACREVLSLPVHNLLSQEDIEKVASAVHKVVAAHRQQ
jgi:perosamine synthetase